MKKRLFISFVVVMALLFMFSPLVEVAETESEISINKSAEPLFYSEIGQEIEFEILIENTGNTDLDNVRVIDELLGIDELIGSLDSGEDKLINTTYVITSEDMERGHVENTASVTGENPDFIGKGENKVSAEDSIIIESDIDNQPEISLSKEAVTTTYSTVGDVIDYTITVTNTGNVVLNNVTLVDDLLDLGTDADIGSLEPGEETTISGSYTIVQADLDNGSVSNTAEVSGEDTQGTVVDDDDYAEVVGESNPDISINKEASSSTYSAVGDVINYTITVTNTGNSTLSNVMVTDSKIDLGTEADIGSLEPGEETTISGSYTIVQADLDNGSVSNTAEVSGEDPQGTVVDDDDYAEVVGESNPDISINKEATPDTYSEVGDDIDYTITVTNTGNVTLYNVVVSDTLIDLNTNIGTLEPGEEDTITETYTITQNDLEEEVVENTTTVSAVDDYGTEVDDSGSAVVKADIESEPSISITKEPSPTTYNSVGQEIDYTITVTNNGDVALTDVNVVDDLLTIDEYLGTLEPGDVRVINESYFITEEDIDRGNVYNLATATGNESIIGKLGEEVKDEAEAEITLDFISNPDISITKEATPSTYSEVGDVINYTFTVTNTGNSTLSNVMLTDSKIDLGTEADIGSLEPGEETTVSGSYTIVQEDLNNGSVPNTAEVSGEDSEGTVVEDSDDAEVTSEMNPDISINKEAVPTTYSEAGDIITYTITLENTGNVTLTEVTVTDSMLGLDSNIGTLEPGEVYTLPDQTYTIMQEDIDNGTVENTANVEGKDPTDEPVTDSDDEVVTFEDMPGDTETAWAYNEDYEMTFNELNISNSWGWSNGPLAPEGEYVFELWAGAGQNDFDNGTLVGQVIVSFDEETVHFEMYDDYYLEEVQLYLGNEQPSDASPGQLGYNNDDINNLQEYTIDLSYFTDVDFNESIYIAAHAVVGSW